MNRRDIYRYITDKLITKLNEGVIPWEKSWKHGLPANYITKKVYRGINFLSLCFDDYPSPYYLTYLQCKDKNGYVKKGESASPIIYWKIIERIDEDEVKRIPLLRLSSVFNLSQTSLYQDITEKKGIRSCEEIIKNMENKPDIRNNYSRCYYNMKEDYISLPKIDDFSSMEKYYSALFHELAHSTGHRKRLNRLNNKKDLESYAEEELIAELTSAWLCGLTGIEPKIIDNTASYLSYWIKKLKYNPAYILNITTKVNQAINIILNEGDHSQNLQPWNR